MREEFIEHINASIKNLNYGDRSKFIRDAIVEKLNRAGIETPDSLAAAPVRFGKPAKPGKTSKARDSIRGTRR